MGIGPTSQCETSIDQHEFSQAGNIYLTAEGVRGNRDRRIEELFFLKRLLPTQSEGERALILSWPRPESFEEMMALKQMDPASREEGERRGKDHPRRQFPMHDGCEWD